MPTFVALYRGINVGGHQVPMNKLKSLHEALGLQNVITYIQSGNVVFTSEQTDIVQLTTQIEQSFTQQFSFSAKVMVRTSTELQTIIANNPFQDQPIKEPKWIVVLFLATHPDRTDLEDLQKAHTGPEELHLNGQELYTYYPDGIGRSKLTLSLIERKLKTCGTGRNWNTILKLQELTQH